MSVEHTVERLKELSARYEDVLHKLRREELTVETRLHIQRLRKETLNEMITLIKRIP